MNDGTGWRGFVRYGLPAILCFVLTIVCLMAVGFDIENKRRPVFVVAPPAPTSTISLPPYRIDSGDFVFTTQDVVVPAKYLDHEGEWQEGNVMVPRGYWIVHPLDHSGATTQPLHPVKRSPWGTDGKLRRD
jgi:hypothetical protein